MRKGVQKIASLTGKKVSPYIDAYKHASKQAKLEAVYQRPVVSRSGVIAIVKGVADDMIGRIPTFGLISSIDPTEPKSGTTGPG
jgi:hypothetical protein